MNKILITGGAGFIGYFLAKRLSEDSNNYITILDNLSRGKMDLDMERLVEKENVEFIQADLTDQKMFLNLSNNYNYIYHFAAIIGVKNVLKDPDKVLRVNAVSTLNVFEYAKKIKDIKRVFFSSTSEIYAGTLKRFTISIPTGEDVPLAIEDISAYRTTYALSKMYGESIALVYAKKYGIAVTIGRFHNVYGPRMGFDHVIPETFIKINKSNKVDVPSQNHTRAFCFIHDAIEATIKACTSENTKNEILHIGNPKEEISIKELVLKIAHIMDKKITINELLDTPGSPVRRCPDTSKVERLTGYSPVILLEKGILDTYKWYKEHLDAVSVR
ncbi:MAG: GDP-mannose 4,6-dehydratase [Candidatus Gorgyraea atricola]|nr:GDP-mannose 4,6-dehydratase [Candidatus Gorgyraea atricola]